MEGTYVSDYNTFVDISRSLLNLLWSNFDEEVKNIIANNQMTLTSPEEMDDDKKLSIFLYQATEDAYQKNQPLKMGLNSADGPALFLDLSYMITPNTKDGEKDQILLGKVAQILNDNRVLKSQFLQGQLPKDSQDLHVVFNPLSLDDINKIWTVVSKSKPYRFSLYYVVTMARIDSARSKTVSRVGERDIRYLDKTKVGPDG